MAQTKGDRSKLPQWARFLIEKLEADNASMKRKLNAIVPGGDDRSSEVGYLDYGLERYGYFRPLPPGTIIVFRLDAEKGRKVEVQVMNDRGQPRIHLSGHDDYGSGSLAVRPLSSNSLEVFLDPIDQNR